MSGRAAVLGAGGFIGGHLVHRLLEDGVEVRAFDVKPAQEWWQWPGGRGVHAADCYDVADMDPRDLDRVDEVYDLAADMGGIGFIEGNKAACMLSLKAGIAALEAARDAKVGAFFFASSACVYPDYRQGIADAVALEEWMAYPAQPEDGYGWEKLTMERFCRHFTEDFGLVTRVARFHNIFGPIGTWDGGREKAPAALCRKVALAKLTGDHTIEIWGDGSQGRSFLYVDDCVDGVLALMGSDQGDPVNIGSDRLVRVNDLLDIIEQIAGVKLERRYDTSKPQGVPGRNSDNTLVEKTVGWEPSTSLEDGLERTYQWIYDQVRAAL